MTNGSVLYQRHEGIATLTLNRPETLNAMNEAMMGEMERVLIELEADTAVRVVVLTGAGRAFSSGGDQKRSNGFFHDGLSWMDDEEEGGAHSAEPAAAASWRAARRPCRRASIRSASWRSRRVLASVKAELIRNSQLTPRKAL